MARFTLMQKTINLEQIEGKYSAFAKCPYALPVRLSRKLASDGYGRITVNGIEISRGKEFFMDSVVRMNCMLVPVGEVANEYDREYVISFSGFKAEDGSAFKDASFKFRTLPRKINDHKHLEHDRVAMQAASEGMVLLKNQNNVLPLASDAKLNTFGSAQFMLRNTATGAGLINPRWQSSFHEAVQEHSSFVINSEVRDLYRDLRDHEPDSDLLARASAFSDTAVIFISRTSGEFLDNKPIKGGYYLTDAEDAMIQKVADHFPKTIAVINTGYPIDLKWVDVHDIKAVIYTGFAGMAAGYALTEILDGRVNPSAKLPDSWALDYYDYPSSANFMNYQENDEVPGEKTHGVHLYYEEDIYVGYRYFDTFEKPVQYCFGHGLSYTSFKMETLNSAYADGKIRVTLRVTNTGAMSGKEVIQLYAGLPEGNIEKPKRILIDFAKTGNLKSGESETVTLCAERERLASYDEERKAYVLEKGEYALHVGNSLSHSVAVGTFTLDEEIIVREVRTIAAPVEKFHCMSRKDPSVHQDSEVVSLEERIRIPAERKKYVPKALRKKADKKITFRELRNDPGLLDAFISQLSDDELCKLSVSTGADWYMPWGNGTAGGTSAIRRLRLPTIRVSDGNTGLNIVKPNVGFPSSCTIAATFNKELAEEVGRVIGEESQENHIAVNLGPAMNIHRNILCGRHPEYFSEDPVLAGLMAGHHARGLEKTNTASTYKHMFCNNSETSRKGSHSIVSEQALREIYFRVFEIAMSVQKPKCIMSSYNALNGIYPAESVEILQELLREEWGFDGMIMTDWCSYDTIDPVNMINAGTNWLTEGGRRYVSILKKALKNGEINRAILQDNARFVIGLVLKQS